MIQEFDIKLYIKRLNLACSPHKRSSQYTLLFKSLMFMYNNNFYTDEEVENMLLNIFNKFNEIERHSIKDDTGEEVDYILSQFPNFIKYLVGIEVYNRIIFKSLI